MGPRIRAVDWLRGLVMVLMAVDHAGGRFDARHLHGDRALGWHPGAALPAGEFLTRWITHLCAPTFVLLAGVSLALSIDRRRDEAGRTAFIVKRGLFIAAMDPIWMSLGFTLYRVVILQVLYAIGMSLVCMAFLRKLPTRALVVLALGIQLGGEWVGSLFPGQGAARAHPVLYAAGALLWNALPIDVGNLRVACAYPLVPWLSIMMIGFVLGRALLASEAGTDNPTRARRLAWSGVGLLGLFILIRGVDGYGNWGLHRDSPALLQWLHVAKYPPSIAYTTLELGLAFLLLALFFAADEGGPRPALALLEILGSTAFFFYLLHVHLLNLAQRLLPLDRQSQGLAKTYLGAAAVVLALSPLCARYRRYKRERPDGWTRYV